MQTVTMQSRASAQFSKALLSESIGSFALVFFGCGSIVINELSQGFLGNVGLSLTVGLVVSVLIIAFGASSGAHFNPAVTIGLLYLGRFPLKATLPYVVAQTVGAICGAGALRFLFGTVANLGATQPSGSVAEAFGIEFLMTLFLMFVIATTSLSPHLNKYFVAIAIGATIGLEAFVAGPISGGSMNPARSIAPAIITGKVSTLWIYICAPLLGSLCAALLFKLFYRSVDEF